MGDAFASLPFDPDAQDVSGFTCGEPSLDTWVWLKDSRVVGYYALAAHKVAREDVPARLGRGGPREIPAVLLAKLGRDGSLRGQGWGAVLVADALTRSVEAAMGSARDL